MPFDKFVICTRDSFAEIGNLHFLPIINNTHVDIYDREINVMDLSKVKKKREIVPRLS